MHRGGLQVGNQPPGFGKRWPLPRLLRQSHPEAGKGTTLQEIGEAKERKTAEETQVST